MAVREAIATEKYFVYPSAALDKDGTVRIEAESCENIELLQREVAEICDARGNVIMERHKFYKRSQKEFESFQGQMKLNWA